MLAPQHVDPELEELFSDILGDWRAKRGAAPQEIQLDRDLWSTLEKLDLTMLTTSTGAGATWLEAAALLRAAARVAAPVPLAEHDLLASWMLERAGMEPLAGIGTVAVLDERGVAVATPWASACDRIVIVRPDGSSWRVADVPASDVMIVPGWDLAGQPRDRVEVGASTHGHMVEASVVEELRLRSALARAVQMTGAMDRAVELCVRFATEHRQFGRPLSKFQAVQHLIADAACESSLARAATDAAVATLASGTATLSSLELQVAVARSVTGHAASIIVRHAHQVHGAIGTTFEHPLHELTKPILAWRSEFGSVRRWDARLTDLLVSSDQSAWALGIAAR